MQLEDGNWYEIDVTWDDSNGSYKYFCIPSSLMEAQRHTRNNEFMKGFETIVPVTQESDATRALRSLPKQLFEQPDPELPTGGLSLADDAIAVD